MQGGRLRRILSAAGLKPYAWGKLYVELKFPSENETLSKGEGSFRIEEGKLNAGLLRREGISLPPRSLFTARGKVALVRGMFEGWGRIETSFGTLAIHRLYSDLSLRIFKTQYNLSIASLQDIQGITRVPLQGSLKTDGTLYFDRKKMLLQFTGMSPSLGGKLHYLFDGEGLRLRLEKIEIPKVLRMTLQPPYCRRGTVEGEIQLRDFKRLDGFYRLEAKGEWGKEALPGSPFFRGVGGERFVVKSAGKLKNAQLHAKADYRSPSLSLNVDGMKLLLLNRSLSCDFRLGITDLNRFDGGVFSGPFDLKGKFAYLGPGDRVLFKASSGSFGGKLKMTYTRRRLDVKLEAIDPSLLLLRAHKVHFLEEHGTLNAETHIRFAAKKTGTYSYQLRAGIDRRVLKKLYKIDLGKDFVVRSKGKGRLSDENLSFAILTETPMGMLRFKKGFYEIARKKLQTLFALKIPDLRKLRPLTGKTYYGPFALKGKLLYTQRDLRINAAGREWGGTIRMAMEGSRLRILTEKTELKELEKTLGYPTLLHGEVGMDFREDLKKEQGRFMLKGTKIRFEKNRIGQSLGVLTGFELSREIFDSTLLKGRIQGELLRFDFNARSRNLELKIEGGHFDRSRRRIDAVMQIRKGNKRYRVKIEGPITRPQVIPLMGRELQKKIDHELEKHHLDKKIPKKLGPVKNMIERLF